MARGKKSKKKRAEPASAELPKPGHETEPVTPASERSPTNAPKVFFLKPWLDYYREYPVMLLPLLLNLLGIAWVIYNSNRPWVTVEGLVSSRTVTKYVVEDEDSYNEYFPASISYSYVFQDQEFTGEFEDDKIEDGFWSTKSYADAVVEAKRWKIGDPVPILVDSAHPEISTLTRPKMALPLLALSVVCGALLLLGIDGSRGELALGCGVAIITSPVLFFVYQARVPAAESTDSRYSVLPYISVMRSYPSLGYVPQNKLHQFETLEQLLKEWGRPDDLWIDDQDGGRRLTMTYRHGADWSQAWSVDLQLPEGEGPPVPVGPPRQDDPER